MVQHLLTLTLNLHAWNVAAIISVLRLRLTLSPNLRASWTALCLAANTSCLAFCSPAWLSQARKHLANDPNMSVWATWTSLTRCVCKKSTREYQP